MGARRLAATAIDLALAAAWAGLLLLLWSLLPIDPAAVPSSVPGQLIGLATLTIPVTVVYSSREYRGGTPGKRLVGLRTVGRSGGPVTRREGLVRIVAKFALPWELAHTAIWRSADGTMDGITVGLLVGAYLLPIAAGLGVALSGRPWHDRLAGTTVRLDDDRPTT